MDKPNSIMEALYYKCYYSYLKGNLQDTLLFFDIIRSEFSVYGGSKALYPEQFKILAEIKKSLEGGSTSSRGWVTEKIINIEGENKEQNQKSLVKKVYHEGINRLKDLLQADDRFYLYNIEHPCDSYGRVDMYFRDSITAYPLEIKIGHGDHALLGQILKYDLYCKFHLHEKHYRKVQAVTLCKSYDQGTLTELKRQGIVTLIYSSGEKLILEKL